MKTGILYLNFGPEKKNVLRTSFFLNYKINIFFTKDTTFLHSYTEETMSAEFIPMMNAVLKMPRGRHQ